MELALEEQMEQYEKTVASVAESLNQLAAPVGGRHIFDFIVLSCSPPGCNGRQGGSRSIQSVDSASVVDAQLTKARAFVTSLHNEIAQSKKVCIYFVIFSLLYSPS